MASSRQSGPEEASACSQGDTDVPIRAQRNDLSMSLSGNIGGCPQCAAQSCRTAEMAVKVSKLKKKIVKTSQVLQQLETVKRRSMETQAQNAKLRNELEMARKQTEHSSSRAKEVSMREAKRLREVREMEKQVKQEKDQAEHWKIKSDSERANNIQIKAKNEELEKKLEDYQEKSHAQKEEMEKLKKDLKAKEKESNKAEVKALKEKYHTLLKRAQEKLAVLKKNNTDVQKKMKDATKKEEKAKEKLTKSTASYEKKLGDVHKKADRKAKELEDRIAREKARSDKKVSDLSNKLAKEKQMVVSLRDKLRQNNHALAQAKSLAKRPSQSPRKSAEKQLKLTISELQTMVEGKDARIAELEQENTLLRSQIATLSLVRAGTHANADAGVGEWGSLAREHGMLPLTCQAKLVGGPTVLALQPLPLLTNRLLLVSSLLPPPPTPFHSAKTNLERCLLPPQFEALASIIVGISQHRQNFHADQQNNPPATPPLRRTPREGTAEGGGVVRAFLKGVVAGMRTGDVRERISLCSVGGLVAKALGGNCGVAGARAIAHEIVLSNPNATDQLNLLLALSCGYPRAITGVRMASLVCDAIRITLSRAVLSEGSEREESLLRSVARVNHWRQTTPIRLTIQRAELGEELISILHKGVDGKKIQDINSAEGMRSQALRALRILSLGYGYSELFCEIINTIHRTLQTLLSTHPGVPWLIRALGATAGALAPPTRTPPQSAVRAILKSLREDLGRCVCLPGGREYRPTPPIVAAAAATAFIDLSEGDSTILSPVLEWYTSSHPRALKGKGYLLEDTRKSLDAALEHVKSPTPTTTTTTLQNRTNRKRTRGTERSAREVVENASERRGMIIRSAQIRC
ncbi:hypothetical protein AAMO2058_001499000 [Amorphochlora amoebiformis]